MDLDRLAARQQDVVGGALQVGVEEAAEDVAQERAQVVLDVDRQPVDGVARLALDLLLAVAAGDHVLLEGEGQLEAALERTCGATRPRRARRARSVSDARPASSVPSSRRAQRHHVVGQALDVAQRASSPS